MLILLQQLMVKQQFIVQKPHSMFLVLDFWLYSSLQFFQSFWNYRYDEEKTNTIASGVFYIIGAILSLNMITFISWLVCGILLIKKDKIKA